MNLDNCLKRHYNRYRGIAYLNLYCPKIFNVKNKLEPIINLQKERVSYNKFFYKPFHKILHGPYLKKGNLFWHIRPSKKIK